MSFSRISIATAQYYKPSNIHAKFSLARGTDITIIIKNIL